MAHSPRRPSCIAHERAADVLTAFHMAVEKLEKQLHRYKEKIQDHRRRSAAGDVVATPASSDTGEGE